MDICSQAGFKSVRTVERIVNEFKAALPPTLLMFINCFLSGGPSGAPFPKLFVSPKFCTDDERVGKLLTFNRLKELDFQLAGKKDLYHTCVKAGYFESIRDRADTKWREFLTVPADLSPSWRLFYKGPLPKRFAVEASTLCVTYKFACFQIQLKCFAILFLLFFTRNCFSCVH